MEATMARKPPLRAVGPDEERDEAPKRKVTIIEAAESGNHRELLVAMRGRIARTVNDQSCPPRDLAALTRRLQDIAKEIDVLDLRAKQEASEDAVSGDEEWDGTAI
jgi:hypothetical protein